MKENTNIAEETIMCHLRKGEAKMTMGERIKMLRVEKGLSQAELAKILGVARPTVSNWEKDIIRPLRRLNKVADFFGVSTDFLMCNTDRRNFAMNNPTPRSVRIPVFSSIPAGIPIEAIQDIEDWEEIPADLASHGEYFALKVKGNGMEPTIHDGEIAIVKTANDVPTGSIALVYVNGHSATLKEVRKSKEGLTLVGHNVAVFSPQFFTWKQVKELPVTIGAVLTETRHKFSF